MFSLMMLPFFACLILTGIHTYLGIHVIRRGVIFVDLALAQMAALGSTIAILAGHDLHDPEAYYYSLGMTFVGALLFSLSRQRRERVPQEAVIGITYAVSAAAAIIILDRAPGGAEHIRSLLVGNILTVTPQEIAKTAILYSIIGIFHWAYRSPFLMISFEPGRAEAERYSVRWWDLLFYMTFGFVVTSSVAMAGVLLVFAFLIVPAVISLMLAEKILSRLLIGWGVGLIASLLGLSVSVVMDMPTGASIVCAFGFLLLLLIIGSQIRRKLF